MTNRLIKDATGEIDEKSSLSSRASQSNLFDGRGTDMGNDLHKRKPQSYARPAGRILRRLERLGLVVQGSRPRGSGIWYLTAKGDVFVRGLSGTLAI